MTYLKGQSRGSGSFRSQHPISSWKVLQIEQKVEADTNLQGAFLWPVMNKKKKGVFDARSRVSCDF